jgi:hypothetical protein
MSWSNGPHLLAQSRQPRAQLGGEIAKRKPVWEKSLFAPDCEMRNEKYLAVLQPSARIL